MLFVLKCQYYVLFNFSRFGQSGWKKGGITMYWVSLYRCIVKFDPR